MDYSSAFVCFMGIGTVFFGLICLIVLTKLMSSVCHRRSAPVPAPQVSVAPAPQEEDRTMLVAAISAAIAEDLGTDVTGIRILSMKKL